MAVRKVADIVIKAGPNGRTDATGKGIKFYSLDKNSAAIDFYFRNQDGSETDLINANISLLLLIKDGDNQEEFPVIESDLSIMSRIKGHARYIIPDRLRGYVGQVEGYVSLSFPDESRTDECRFTFSIERSKFEEQYEKAGDYYVTEIQAVFDDVKSKLDGMIPKMETEFEKLVASLTEYANEKIIEYDKQFVTLNQTILAVQTSIYAVETDIDALKTQTQNIQQTQTAILKSIEENKLASKEDLENLKQESSANVIYQLVGKEKVRMTFTADFSNKESGSDDKNPHWASAVYGLNELPSPSDFKTELVQLRYDSLKILDGQKTTVNTVAGTANQYPCLEHKWDIVEIIKRELSEDFFVDRGAIDKASQATVAKKIIVSPLESSAWGFGTCPSGNSLKIANHINGVGWQTDQLPPNTTNLVKQITARNTATPSIDDEGFLRTIIYTEASSKTVQSQINVDYGNLVFSIEISMNEHIKSMMVANQVESIATQEEAETGEDNTKTMTPLRTKQQIDKRMATKDEVIAGASTDKLVSPATLPKYPSVEVGDWVALTLNSGVIAADSTVPQYRITSYQTGDIVKKLIEFRGAVTLTAGTIPSSENTTSAATIASELRPTQTAMASCSTNVLSVVGRVHVTKAGNMGIGQNSGQTINYMYLNNLRYWLD